VTCEHGVLAVETRYEETHVVFAADVEEAIDVRWIRARRNQERAIGLAERGCGRGQVGRE
jgi:hypothetical protein